MELVEGETLLDRLKRGPLPLDLTLRYAIEVADALDKAHRQGVIHRDLKPGNVILTKSGSKLMDFGLAKRGSAEDGRGGGVSALPTRERPLTEAGSLLGTFQYMSPEQLEGRDADARSDIWALGAVVYEMARGKRAFEGKSQASLIGAILKDEPPPIGQLRPMSPPALDRLVKVCLAKDPDDRLQTAHDVMQELKWIAEGGPQAAAAQGSRWGERSLWAAGLLTAAGLAWLAGTARRPKQKAAHAIQFEIHPPEGTELQPYLAVSPDGARIAFTAKDTSGVDRLFMHALRTGKTEGISGTEGASRPFWSPEGRSVGFHADGKLKRVEVGGGAPQTVAAVAEARGTTWTRDGWIVFAGGGEVGLSRVRATGGPGETLTALDDAASATSHRWPHSLPDGRLLYLVIRPGTGTISIRGSPGGSASKPLLDVASAPIFDSGHLLYVRDGALRAQPLDPVSASLTGEPATLAEDIASSWSWLGSIPVSAAAGVLALRAGALADSRFTWIDRNGQPQGTLGPPGVYAEPTLSPDGRSVAAIAGQGVQFLAVVDVASAALRRLTFGTEAVTPPCWSSDGHFLAYASNRSGTHDIYSRPVSGTGAEETLVQSGKTAWPDDLPGDGRFLLYETRRARSHFDLWVLPLTGDRKARPFVETEANEVHGAFSPDGRLVAYVSDTTGRPEVYVRAFPSGEGPWQVSAGGGDQPRWRGDGHELFYVSPDLRLMAARVSGADRAFKVEPSTPLFRVRITPPSLSGSRNEYDVAPDGRRFLINQLVDDPAKATITVVINWPARLRN